MSIPVENKIIDHTVTLQIEFPPVDQLPPIKGILCDDCGSLAERVVEDYRFGWGTQQRLEVVVPDIPQIRCGCGLSIEDEMLRLIEPLDRAILDALEERDREKIMALAPFFTADDLLRVEDYALNRKPPYRRLP